MRFSFGSLLDDVESYVFSLPIEAPHHILLVDPDAQLDDVELQLHKVMEVIVLVLEVLVVVQKEGPFLLADLSVLELPLLEH